MANALNIDPFFDAVSIDANRSNFTWVFERYPDNWYRSNPGYGLRQVVADILASYEKHPEMMVWGGNAGSTNNVVPLGITSPTDVDGFGCFLYNARMANLPNQLSDTTASTIEFAFDQLEKTLGPIFQASFGCGPYLPDQEFENKFRNFTETLKAALKKA